MAEVTHEVAWGRYCSLERTRHCRLCVDIGLVLCQHLSNWLVNETYLYSFDWMGVVLLIGPGGQEKEWSGLYVEHSSSVRQGHHTIKIISTGLNARLKLLHQSLRLNWCVRRTARFADEQYVPDHPGWVHGCSLSCARPCVAIAEVRTKYHPKMNVTHCNGSGTLHCPGRHD